MTGDTILEKLIVGRVPHIYAFETNTIPSYLKVGDTNRPVSMRLDEWRRIFRDLIERPIKDNEARVKGREDIYFRDYSVHRFLEFKRKRRRLKPEDPILVGQKDADGNPLYYSSEFFQRATPADVQAGILDIRVAYEKNTFGDYQFYDASKIAKVEEHFTSTGIWKLRPNQEEAVKAFMRAVQAGENKLLMYAVMRFGKSFTSMYCAHVMNGGEIGKTLKNGEGAKLVVVVSGKKDVLEEWQKAVESPENFRNDYQFITSRDLVDKPGVLKRVLSSKGQKNRAVVFLTLQDLAGDVIKSKHRDLFTEKVDLLIVDETHFAARAEVYGKVLQDPNYEKDTSLKKVTQKDDDFETDEVTTNITKTFNAKVRLHLSGTPYRILMGGEFKDNQIISCCQFSDIVAAQEKWDREHLFFDEAVEKKADGTHWVESDNPYFGFPQMIRFAFAPNESSIAKLNELRSKGVTYAFSALFRPQSIGFDKKGRHKKFKYEKQVLELLEVIDGSRKEKGLLGFLDYPKIKYGQMCRHIVCVLPYCASCDALEALIKKNRRHFKNLKGYTIINISGVEDRRTYANLETVKKKIEESEAVHKKTLTLTVNRMLTGTTVREWDTMLYFKDTESPQEYDQAIFRLQNQYINLATTTDGRTIKVNMKPQTLLVDFDPNRLFRLQERKSHVFNVNSGQLAGNDKLEERITEELRVSPVVWANADRLVQATATNIMDAVHQYSSERGIKEEAREIIVDVNEIKNCPNLFAAIKKEIPIGEDAGISERAYKEGDTALDGLDDNRPVDDELDDDDSLPKLTKQKNLSEDEIRLQQFQSYVMRVLFFAYLTKSENVTSLARILEVLPENGNVRIATHLQLRAIAINEMRSQINQNTVREIDYRIRNMSELSRDKKFCANPEERAERAIRKIGKLGKSIIVTPNWLCKDMVALIPDKVFRKAVKNHELFIDINGKVGEFATALYRRFIALGYKVPEFKDLICTIPATMREYEFTLKVYQELELDTSCIAAKFTAYDLLNVKDDSDKINYERIKLLLTQPKPFEEISMNDKVSTNGAHTIIAGFIGNPPFHIETAKKKSATNGQAPRTSIYHFFQLVADNISTEFTSLIYPGRGWIQRSGKGVGMADFGLRQINDPRLAELRFYQDSGAVFPSSVAIADGVSIVLKNMHKKTPGFHYVYHEDGKEEASDMPNPGEDGMPLKPFDGAILLKARAFCAANGLGNLNEKIFPRSFFGIESNFVANNPKLIRPLVGGGRVDWKNEVKLLANDKAGKAGRSTWYVIKRSAIKENNASIDLWKVVVSSANAGGQKRDWQLELLDNHSAFGRSRVALGMFKTKEEAENFFKFCQSYLVRFLFLMSAEALKTLAKEVPCFVDWKTAGGMIDFSSDINSQLCTLLKLTDSEANYVAERICSIDNSRGKRTCAPSSNS